MKVRTAAAAFAATLAAALFAAGALVPNSAAAKADGWKVDLPHSFVLFTIRHMDVGWVHGRFNDIAGTISYDSENPAASSVEITIKTESVDTGTQKRDDHLRTPDFFNVSQFPTITFKSTSVKKTDDTHLAVTGDLTLHGITKAVSVLLTKSGPVTDLMKRTVMGFDGTFNVKRTDWGMSTPVGPGTTSDDVQLTLSIEATKQ